MLTSVSTRYRWLVVIVVAILLLAATRSAATKTWTVAGTGTAPVPAGFDGTYRLVWTQTAAEGVVSTSTVGAAETYVWTVTAQCPSGRCAADVQSSSGNAFTLQFQGGAWSRPPQTGTMACLDPMTGADTGVSADVEANVRIDPVEPGRPVPSLPALHGTEIDTVDAPGCGGGALTYVYTLDLTRIG